MKILYVARHGPQDNMDEDAIAYALQQLGHEVICIQERHGKDALGYQADFCLFHKWEDHATIEQMKLPKVFWYFDLVRTDDLELRQRTITREDWVNFATNQCDLGFLTDGDWVNQDKTGKLNWLTQGADERTLTYLDPDPNINLPSILFTGVVYGSRRRSHIESLQSS